MENKQKNKISALFLSAGQPMSTDNNIAFLKIDEKYNIYDWNLRKLNIQKKEAFIGLGFDKTLEKYTGCHENVIKIDNWRLQGSVGTLLKMVEEIDQDCFIVYGDVLLTKEINGLKLNKSTVFYYNSDRQQDKLSDRIIFGNKHNDFRHDQNTVFSGLVFLKKNDIEYIKNNIALISGIMSDKHLGALISLLIKLKIDFDYQNANNYIHEISEKEDLSKIVLTTKANTLANLRNCLNEWKIPPQVDFTMEEWQNDKDRFYDKIKKLSHPKFVVRSSSKLEDSFNQSNAGAFTSKLNILNDIDAINDAVFEVFESYGKNSLLSEQILVQPMYENVEVSGVAFTKTLAAGSPYYVVNIDDYSGQTDTVTSGTENDLKTYYVLKTTQPCDIIDETLRKIISGLKEIEKTLSSDSLDIEFCISHNELVLLQVRPLIADESTTKIPLATYEAITKLEIEKYNVECAKVAKNGTFAKMPDWNPAEIIGDNPRPFATCLYDILITSNIWAQQRYEYGNRDLRGQPLVTCFSGKPFVNVKLSLESFLPRNLSQDLSSRLLDYYLDIFEKSPQYHDKIEFKVIPSSFNLSTEDMMGDLRKAGFLDAEIREYQKELLATTVKAISSFSNLRDEFQKNEFILTDLRWSEMDNSASFYEAINVCTTFGTLPFAHFARLGFVAVSLLKSGVEQNIISEEEYDTVLKTVNSVTSEMETDFNELKTEHHKESRVKLRDAFNKKYGHLRPGTYDITVKRYDEAFDYYFDLSTPIQPKLPTEKDPLGSNLILTKLYSQLPVELKLVEKDKFIEFVIGAIEFREYSKFCFTALVSNLMKALTKNINDFDAEELSFLSFHEAVSYLNEDGNLTKQTYFRQLISDRKNRYQITCQLELPNIISSERDFYYFESPPSDPNFIGKATTEGEVVYLISIDNDIPIKDKLVCIHSADPGYDWIFSHEIKGLITEFGGANSHMAIRCSELGIPAAIGVGTEKFSVLVKQGNVRLDCRNRKLGVT
ncbi:PEP-utilizing enzyme [Paracoccaceae bacterium]|nr:PEP-utilizing enzyme [Paracoccaceae bacterium]